MLVFVLLSFIVLPAGFPTTTSAISVVRENLPDAQGSVWMTVSGTVLSIDARRGTLILNHGPLETAPGGTVECVFSNRRNVISFRPGDSIMALARTDHHPWLLRFARIIQVPNDAKFKVARGLGVQARSGPA